MARALTFQRNIVPLADRKRYLERLTTRRDYFRGAACRFWTFEETDLAGAFLEFIESDSEQSLAAAIASAPDQYVDGARIYREVELD